MLRARRIWGLCMALVLTFMSACLFEAREPLPPASGGGGVVSLDSPERPFQAITTSFNKLNDVDYDRAISSGYRFFPLQDDSLDQDLIGTSVYDNWTKSVEMAVVNQTMLPDAQKITVTWGTTPLINNNTFVRWDVDYTLVIIARVTGDTTSYAGNSQIDVRNEGGNWRITQWKDISAGNGVRTWGYLRGISRLRLGP